MAAELERLARPRTMRAMYGLVVFLHVLGAFVFVIAHGASMLAAFRLRGEIDRQRIAAILDLSSAGIGLMYVGLLVLLLAGVLAGFMGDHWGRGWIWAALGTLVAVIAAMYLLATPFYGRMRAAAGAQVPEQVAARLEPPATPEDLASWQRRTGRCCSPRSAAWGSRSSCGSWVMKPF